MRFFAIYFVIILSLLMAGKVNACFSYTSKESLEIAKELGWVKSHENRCGGYYLEAPFLASVQAANGDRIEITSTEGLVYSQRGTSISQGLITITRGTQQISATKGFLYRNESGKLSSVDLLNHVTLRQPNALIIAKSATYDLTTNTKQLKEIYYRVTIYSQINTAPTLPTPLELTQPRKVTQLSAWGKAAAFSQINAHVFQLEEATYTTCPPTSNTWQVKASKIELNRETGRGIATHARVTVKGIPVFYAPIINFPIDSRRQTGFLWPTLGTSSKSGGYFSVPYYWNLAPNYDTTITPTLLTKRGLELTDLFRYLTPRSDGKTIISILPNDKMFKDFQETSRNLYSSSADPIVLAELRRVENASTTRKAFSWKNFTRFNDHWTSDIDYNWVSDDYYLRDLSNNLNEVTQNQLLQQAEVDYKGQNWNFLGRLQSYQTLHPIDETLYQNQYSRFPQLALNGEYPDSLLGLDYAAQMEATHFDIRNTPGVDMKFPMGDRFHLQPGIRRSLHSNAYYVEPRLQFAFTQYELGHVMVDQTKYPSRALPIFDISSGLYFDRDLQWFHQTFRQTLEPQIYYTYVPYRNQSDLPIFDTTVNTLTYDQLFTYNRFSGVDRIGDANQISAGVTTRFIDQESGYEKIRLGLGEIFYFQRRRVTLCNDASCSNVPLCNGSSCTDYPSNIENRSHKSPLAGVLTYFLNPDWSVDANAIWSNQTGKVDNETITLHYQPVGTQKIFNAGYSFVRQGDILPGDDPNSSKSNLSQTDFSFNWPFLRDWSMVGRWTQNWNHRHFQNLLYGLQYDSCCWAVRFVTGRAFTNLNPNNTYQYNTEFYLQFALKGLGNIGTRDPSQRLSSNITGYQSTFGQDF